MDDPEFVIRNIPASVVTDIERVDKAIEIVSEMAYGEGTITKEDAEVILDALHDIRSGILYLAEKHDKLVLKLQEHNL